MKKLLTSVAMFLCSLLTFAQFSGSGSGTESDPYKIMNPIQLNQMRNYLNTQGVYFKLMSDIDLTEFLENENPSQGWQPVGTSSTPFKGVLDGNGKSIVGLWIDRKNEDNVGLFGNMVGGKVKNLTLSGNLVRGKNNVGFLAGLGGDIEDCTFIGNVYGDSYVGGCVGQGGSYINILSNVNVEGSDNYVGGITGQNGTFQDCKVINSYIKGKDFVGGLCGENINQVLSSYAYSNIEGFNYVGGIVGCTTSSSNIINNSGFCGKIEAISKVGGIAGEYTHGSHHDKYTYQPEATLINSYAIGDIICSGDFVGGLVGYTDADKYETGSLKNRYYVYNVNKIAYCYYSGNLKGLQNIGGIVGYKVGGSIESCYSKGNISGAKNVGGICGSMSNFGMAELVSNISNVSSIMATEENIGRLYGIIDNVSLGELGTEKENKALNRTIVIKAGVAQDVFDDVQNGTGVSPTTLKLKATYVAMGWDFTDTWEIQETECYPYMKIQTAPPVITSELKSGATTISGKCVDGGTVTLEVDGVKQQMVSSGNVFSFNVSPLQAGHEVRICAKADGKEQSYFTTELVAYLGSGKESDPYQVYTASDLTGVYRKGYFKLMNDIDLTDYINQFSPTEGWQSIGRDGSETIHFDGNGHKITGLWCNTTRDNTGLFSCFANGTIKNLTIETAKNKQVKGGANTGILIGKMMNGTIENCKVSGTVTDGTPVGGIIGLMDGGTITLSQSSVTINTTGKNSYVGGIVGDITSGEIDQCVTNGFYTAEGSESYVGGLVGKNSATITNCYSNATITSTYSSAGIVAYNYALVENCYATGNIISSNFGAGVVGYNDGENAIVRNCAAMNNKIVVTYESQQVQQGGGYGMRILGGYKNGAPDPELNNYALKTMQVSVNNVPQKVYDDIVNGVGKTGEELVTNTTYQELGWDFSNIWGIKEEGNYPSLLNNEATVTKPGEETTSEPDPDPVVSTSDKITVDALKTFLGKTSSFSINLENTTTDFTAYQFDLTLPEGITLAKNESNKFLVTKTSRYADNDQSLNITQQEGNTYKFLCFSMSNSVITGTNGAILNTIVDVSSTMSAETYEGKISNIIFTKADGTQIGLNEAKFNIVVNSYILGDANNDGTINVSDIVEIVNYIMNNASSRFVKVAADINEDGDVNVTDIVRVVSVIMSGGQANSRGAIEDEDTSADYLTLNEIGDHQLSLGLHNEANYVASQFVVTLSEGMTLDNINLNSDRCGDHILVYSKESENRYKVLIYSITNSRFAGDEGELLSIKTTGRGYVNIDDITFVTSGIKTRGFSSIGYGDGSTGINEVESYEKMNIYSIDGRLVRRQATNTNGLTKGIYIVNGKKRIVK